MGKQPLLLLVGLELERQNQNAVPPPRRATGSDHAQAVHSCGLRPCTARTLHSAV